MSAVTICRADTVTPVTFPITGTATVPAAALTRETSPLAAIVYVPAGSGQRVVVDAIGIGEDADVGYPVGGRDHRVVDNAAALDRFAGCQPHGSAHQPPAVPESAPECGLGWAFCGVTTFRHRCLTPFRSRVSLASAVAR